MRWYNCILAQYPGLVQLLGQHTGRRGAGRPVVETGKSAGPARSASSATSSEPKDKVDGSFEVDLPGAEMGKVCTRFPPEPSGYLHIGHAKAALLNQFFAQKYQGRLIVRFDDTNPAKEKDEFVDSILQDLETLGVKGDIVTYTSDYFPQLMEMCEKLIKEGKAYVDDTEREQMQMERKALIESRCRNTSVEENLKLWKEMIAGTDRGTQCCVRGKLDMSNPNASLRDPVYYRCNPTPHHRVGSKYKVYPTYDFACPFVDSIEGVTHALRSSEYHDRNDQYYRVLEDMQLRRVHVWDFSRLNFVYTLLSKRKLQWFVDNGFVEGWHDPRFPTVQGIIRRGLTIEALKQFILSQVLIFVTLFYKFDNFSMCAHLVILDNIDIHYFLVVSRFVAMIAGTALKADVLPVWIMLGSAYFFSVVLRCLLLPFYVFTYYNVFLCTGSIKESELNGMG